MPDFGRARVSAERFRGLRCVHTHLNGEKLTQDDLTDLALLRLDLMATIQVDAKPVCRISFIRRIFCRRPPKNSKPKPIGFAL
jgi:hypothetical protein